MNSEEIKLEIKYTEAEYLSAAGLLTLRDSDLLFRIILFSVFVMAVASILTGLMTDYPWWAAGIATGLLLAASYYNGLVRQARRYFRGEPKFRDQYQFIFSDEGIAAKTTQIDVKLAWSLYTKVLEADEVYVMVYGKDIRMMTVIPKRAFRDSLQENAFRDLLARHITSRSGSAKLHAKEEPAGEYKPTSLNPPDWR